MLLKSDILPRLKSEDSFQERTYRDQLRRG